MNFTKKRIWLIVLIILAVTVVCASFARRGKNPVSDAINSAITPVQTGILKITHPINEFFSYISQSKSIKLENEELKAENIKLLAKTADASELIKENERLKKLLDISDDMGNSVTVAAKVVAYEPNNWFSYITINKGKSSGIEISDPVITSEGVLGQVSETGRNWAKISTVINSESSVGVRIVRNGEIGIVQGDSRLSRTNKCKLSYLAENAAVIAGDILETSGLGGIYPPGLMVGKITDIRKDNMGRLDYAEITPFIDFDNLYEVTVITEWTPETEGFGDMEQEDISDENEDESDSADYSNNVG